MKTYSILIILLFTSFISFSQDFEGRIVYHVDYFSNTEDKSAIDIFGQLESKDSTYFKKGYFLHLSTTDFMYYLLWRAEDTCQYWKNKQTLDTVWFSKTNSRPEEFDSSFVEMNVETIADYLCNRLVVFRKGTKYSYYFSNQLFLDPKAYKNYSNLAKNRVIEIMKSPYLKLEMESSYGGVIMTGEKVVFEKLDKALFDIPIGPRKENQYKG